MFFMLSFIVGEWVGIAEVLHCYTGLGVPIHEGLPTNSLTKWRVETQASLTSSTTGKMELVLLSLAG